MTKRKIGVLGAGTWGMALARMLTVSGNEVQVWSAIEAEVDNLSTTRVHPNLPGMKIPAELQFTKSIEEVCTGKDVLLFAVPSVFVRGTTAKARPYIPDGQILVDVAKGMEPDTLYTMTEVIADELRNKSLSTNFVAFLICFAVKPSVSFSAFQIFPAISPAFSFNIFSLFLVRHA